MIRLDDVEKTYRTRRGELVHAVEDVSVSIRENEFVTFVGPSGCGKSTLLKLVAGLYRPRWGTCSIDGFDLRLVDEASLRRCVAIVEHGVQRELEAQNVVTFRRLQDEQEVRVGRLSRARPVLVGLPYQPHLAPDRFESLRRIRCPGARRAVLELERAKHTADLN